MEDRQLFVSTREVDREEDSQCSFVCVFAAAGDQWKDSEAVNSTQGFYSLTGLKPGTQYHLMILHNNNTQWERLISTGRPGMCVFGSAPEGET